MQDGETWKQSGILQERFGLGLALFADGLSMFNSNQYSVWPAYVFCLNLPPDERYAKNIYSIELTYSPIQNQKGKYVSGWSLSWTTAPSKAKLIL